MQTTLRFVVSGVAIDGSGNLLIADYGNNRVRRVDALTGTITMVAANGAQGFGGDGGPATRASLNLPEAVAVEAGRHIFIADSGNGHIRRVDIYACMCCLPRDLFHRTMGGSSIDFRVRQR